MSNIKHTKNELKAQKEALQRFEKFLPMLQLKKQQLQSEIQRITGEIVSVQEKENNIREIMNPWISLFSETDQIEQIVSLEEKEFTQGNIAGVVIPVFSSAKVSVAQYDLFSTPPWFDEAVDACRQLISLRVEREALSKQRELISEELRTTSQRLNLFEKVKIPECRENIRVIKIFLGDQQTAAVARGKLAKKRSLPSLTEMAA